MSDSGSTVVFCFCFNTIYTTKEDTGERERIKKRKKRMRKRDYSGLSMRRAAPAVTHVLGGVRVRNVAVNTYLRSVKYFLSPYHIITRIRITSLWRHINRTMVDV